MVSLFSNQLAHPRSLTGVITLCLNNTDNKLIKSHLTETPARLCRLIVVLDRRTFLKVDIIPHSVSCFEAVKLGPNGIPNFTAAVAIS